MQAISDLDVAGIYWLPDYPNEDSIHIHQPLLSSSRHLSMEDVLSNYPYARTIHDVAVAAAEAVDLASISYLLSYPEYLPIRWQMVCEKATDTAVRIQLYDHGKCSPSIIRPEREIKIDDNNYIILLDQSIRTSNLSLMERILSSYGNKDDLLYPYKNTPIPAISRKYLIEEGYIDVSDRSRCIVLDDPTCIESLTPTEIEEVILYDSISIFKQMVKDTTSLSNVHGRILSYILSTTTDITIIKKLLSRASYDDLKILTQRDIPRSDIFIEIGTRGYFELLSGMTEKEALILTTSPLYLSMKDDVKTFMEWAYPLSFDDSQLLEGAIINSNTLLIEDLLSPDNIDEAISLTYQYHMWQPSVMRKLISAIESIDVTSI